MAKLAEFDSVSASFASVADFAMVYIAEAHPTDGWSFASNPYSFTQHRTVQDRRDAAEAMLSDYNLSCPVYLDNISNEASLLYGALPARFYIIQDGIVRYSSDMGPMGFQVDEVRDWLVQFTAEKTLLEMKYNVYTGA